MAIAETAQLITVLGLRDQLTPGLANATRQLGQTSSAANRTGGGLLSLSNVTQGASNAFGVFKGRIGQLMGITGLVGLGSGLFSIVALMKSGLQEAQDFGGEVSKLTALTGLSAEKMSALAGAFHHFGLESDTVVRIAGMAEKNLGTLTKTTISHGKAVVGSVNFLKQFSFSLLDAGGKVKTFDQLILTAADYFNNPLIPAQTKAAALAKIFGRNWIELVPILKAGSQGIRDASDEAARMGLTLTTDNLQQLKALKNATRDWGTALGGLKLQIGLAVVPELTKLAKAATGFLVGGGREKIVAFFQGLIGVGEKVASVIANDIIPAIQKVIHTWESLPAPIRSILGRSIGGSFALQFLTGISPIGLAANLASNLGGKIAGVIGGALIGKLGGFFNKAVPQLVVGTMAGAVPVFVTNPGFGGPGGLLGAGEGAGAGGAVDAGAGLLGGGSLASVAAAAAAGGALILGLGAFFALTVPEGQGYKRPGPRMTGTGPSDPYGYGPKGQLRGPSGTASDPLHVTDPKVAAANAAAAQHLYALSTSAKKREAGPLPGLTAKQFLADLAATSFIGTAQYKSIFERFSTFRGSRGADPTGEGFLALVKRLDNPKAPAVMFEIKGHLKELTNLEQYYISHGDLKNAAKVQGVINEVDKLIGISRANLPALVTAQRAAERQTASVAHQQIVQSSKFDRLNAISGGIATSARITAAKNFNPTLNATVNVASTNTFNVNSLATSLVSTYTRVNVGNQYQGKIVPI